MKGRFNWQGLAGRASTRLAVLAASATAALGAYALTPERAQLLVPDWLIGGLAGIAIVSAGLIPVATSFRQKAKGPVALTEADSLADLAGVPRPDNPGRACADP